MLKIISNKISENKPFLRFLPVLFAFVTFTYALGVQATEPCNHLLMKGPFLEVSEGVFTDPFAITHHAEQFSPEIQAELAARALPVEVPLTWQNLVEAYRNGYFVYTSPLKDTSDRLMTWEFKNKKGRGIVDLTNPRLERRMKEAQKVLVKGGYRVTFDTAFKEVIRACASAPRPDKPIYAEDGVTVIGLKPPNYWITPQIEAVYTELFTHGYAHSVEVWNTTGELVGGGYGVMVDGVYAGESMFHKESGTSRVALLKLYERLKANGHQWLDTQMVSGETERWGGVYLSFADFLTKLRESQKLGLKF